MATAHDQNLVQRTVAEIVNAGRLAAADELIAIDYVNHGGLIPDLVSGPEAIKISVALYRQAFPDLHVSIDALEHDGDLLVLDWTASNRRQDSIPSVESSRPSPKRMTGTTRIRCAHGQIVESWTDWDSTATLRQAGLTTSTGIAA